MLAQTINNKLVTVSMEDVTNILSYKAIGWTVLCQYGKSRKIDSFRFSVRQENSASISCVGR